MAPPSRRRAWELRPAADCRCSGASLLVVGCGALLAPLCDGGLASPLLHVGSAGAACSTVAGAGDEAVFGHCLAQESALLQTRVRFEEAALHQTRVRLEDTAPDLAGLAPPPATGGEAAAKAAASAERRRAGAGGERRGAEGSGRPQAQGAGAAPETSQQPLKPPPPPPPPPSLEANSSLGRGPRLGANRSSPLGADFRRRVHHIWGRDALNAHKSAKPAEPWVDDEGLTFLKAASATQWTALIGTSLVLFATDLLVLQKLESSFRRHVQLIGLWLLVGALFNGWIWLSLGFAPAVEWCSGYMLEWMLSMDNLFVFHLIFRRYKTPPSHMRYAVFVGIVGALFLRLVFFMVLSTLLHLFHFLRIPFGALLVYSGVQSAVGDDDEDEAGSPKDLWVVRSLQHLLGTRLSNEYAPEAKLFQWDSHGRLQFTLLFVVVACVEATDLLFALDSVSAKVAQIPNQYLSFSSSVIAMFGLRAMFFVVEDLVGMFNLLQYGLCVILVFIGVQLMFSQYLQLAASTACIMILSIFAICIAGSSVVQRPSAAATEPREALAAAEVQARVET